jgi:hypothetical protein
MTTLFFILFFNFFVAWNLGFGSLKAFYKNQGSPINSINNVSPLIMSLLLVLIMIFVPASVASAS